MSRAGKQPENLEQKTEPKKGFFVAQEMGRTGSPTTSKLREKPTPVADARGSESRSRVDSNLLLRSLPELFKEARFLV